MADYHAIAAVCEAIVASLQRRYDPSLFNNDLDFRVYTAQDFAKPMSAGVSLFLYRAIPHGTYRTPASRRSGGATRLPLDLHFLLTVWGRDAALRHSIAGWMMRAMEDSPTLSTSELNATWPDTFETGEGVDLILTQMDLQDLTQVWDSLIRQGYQFSVPYIARVVEIDAMKSQPGHGEVRVSTPGYGEPR